MITVAIVNQKGGTGKTTTAINLGRALVEMDKRVLLIDLDAQGNLTYSLGVEFENSISDVIHGDITFDEILAESGGMTVAPSDTSLSDTELSLTEVEQREFVLKGILSGIDSYDYVFIDCPPSLSLLTINALNAADKVIIPMQMEVLSLQGLDQVTETIAKIRKLYNNKLEIEGVLPVMVDRRRKLSLEIYDHISKNYDLRIFDTGIRTNVRATEAPSFGLSVIDYEPGCNSAQDYLKLAGEILVINNN